MLGKTVAYIDEDGSVNVAIVCKHDALTDCVNLFVIGENGGTYTVRNASRAVEGITMGWIEVQL